MNVIECPEAEPAVDDVNEAATDATCEPESDCAGAPAAEHVSPPAAAIVADSLADSVLILLVMTVVQRLVGFVRGVLVCRWMQPEQLGQWDVAFGFLVLAAPLTVLGLPGSFGRYAEYFRLRGQLRTFLRRTTALSSMMAILGFVAIVTFRESFSTLIFGSPDQVNLVLLVALALVPLTVMNFLTSLFLAVRLYRVVTGLQFFHSLAFALLSLALVFSSTAGASNIVVAFGVASLIVCVGSIPWIRRVWRGTEEPLAVVPQRSFWAKLVPFAMWMWVANLVTNLFEVLDRFMIIHYSGMETNEALRQVGFYHSSRIIPLLMVSVAMLLGSIITPHLSQDWELGRRHAVVARLNLVLKALGWVFLAGSTLVLLVAPYLFEVAFQSKFTGGLAVLPWTLAYCSLVGLNAVSQNYLWCAEKARLGSLSMVVALVLSVGLNLLLLPRFGLHGAVWSTTIANLVSLLLVFFCSSLHGMRIDRGTWLLSLLPLSLGLGVQAAIVALVLVTAAALLTNQILTSDEKRELFATCEAYLTKLRRLFGGRMIAANKHN